MFYKKECRNKIVTAMAIRVVEFSNRGYKIRKIFVIPYGFFNFVKKMAIFIIISFNKTL